MEEIEIVIAGGGICGLAMALALHRKGIKSVVLEKAESVRSTGAGIGIQANGWRVLHQLGVASTLRSTALPILRGRDVSIHKGVLRESPLLPIPVGVEEARCVKRSDLVKVLGGQLPTGTIRFNCQIMSLELDPLTSYPLLHLQDGTAIRAKILIGCDGSNSVVGKFLGLKPKKAFSSSALRGFTEYPKCHGFPNELVRIRSGSTLFGRVPITNKLVYWFFHYKWNSTDISKVAEDPELIQQMTMEALIKNDFPTESVQVVRWCDLSSLSLTHLSYREPWEVMLGNFRRGTVAVAGDAMHMMGPFLGQGGSAAMEDAVILARCLSNKLNSKVRVEAALDQYIKERRMRVARLSAQTYLIGSLLDTTSMIKKFLIIVLMTLLFPNPTAHTQYDCGSLF